jgi:uncharacterized protein YycO
VRNGRKKEAFLAVSGIGMPFNYNFDEGSCQKKDILYIAPKLIFRYV